MGGEERKSKGNMKNKEEKMPGQSSSKMKQKGVHIKERTTGEKIKELGMLDFDSEIQGDEKEEIRIHVFL